MGQAYHRTEQNKALQPWGLKWTFEVKCIIPAFALPDAANKLEGRAHTVPLGINLILLNCPLGSIGLGSELGTWQAKVSRKGVLELETWAGDGLMGWRG